MSIESLKAKIKEATLEKREYVKIESGTRSETSNLEKMVSKLGFKAYIVQKLKLDSFQIIIDL